jgi:putative ABC transporter-associated repeat protein
VALVLATLLGQFAGLLIAAPQARADGPKQSQQVQKVALEGADLVDVAASSASRSLILAGRAKASSAVSDPDHTLFTVDTVGGSLPISMDATSILTNLPSEATASDVTLTMKNVSTPDDGGVQARDSRGAVVLGSAEADPRSVTIHANDRRTDTWVFNAQGRFTMTFQASVSVKTPDGVATWSSPDVTYRIQVGGPVNPTVSLSAQRAQVDAGQDVLLLVKVDPADAAGTVSFKEGDRILGSEASDNGFAPYPIKSLPNGRHEITALFEPADGTEYSSSESVSVVIWVGGINAKVFDSGSLMIGPKLSTDQDMSVCSRKQVCKPTKIVAGVIDRTAADSNIDQSPTSRPWNEQKWYSSGDVIIHVKHRADGYTIPTTVSQDGGDLNQITVPDRNYVKGTKPLQSVRDYLHNPSPDNMLLGHGFSISYNSTTPVQGINSFAFAKSFGSYDLKIGGMTHNPDGGVMSVDSAQNSFSWTSAKPGSSTGQVHMGRTGSNAALSAVPEWSFSAPGVYCVPIQMIESIKDASGDSAKDTKISATGTYTFVVGDSVDPNTVTPCAQVPDSGTGGNEPAAATKVMTDGGHHDIRVYRNQATNSFTFGMDTTGDRDSAFALSNIVWANTQGPLTVSKPNSQNDMTAVGPVGTTYWYFPSASDDHPWPGFSAESLAVDDYQSPVTWRFTGFSRDGRANPSDTTVAMMADTFTSSRVTSLWNTRLGFPTAFEAQPKTHFHPVWAFTQPGIYCIAMQATARTKQGPWISGDGQITMVVGTHADDANIPEDLSTVTPCEKNGAAAPVAPTKSVLGEANASEVYRPDPSDDITDVVELGRDANGRLGQVASTAKSVNDSAVRRDPEDVILTAPTFEPRSQTWVYGGAQGTSRFAFDTTDIRPGDLSGGTVKVALGTPDGPRGGVVGAVNNSNWPSPMQLSTAPGGQRSYEMVAQTTSNASGAGFWWTFSKAGVYCVPVTVTATASDGTTQESTRNYTFIAGNTTDPHGADYVNPSGVTTCSRGQKGTDASQGSGGGDQGEGDQGDELSKIPHSQIYVKNGSMTKSGAVILNQGHIDIASKLRGSTLQTWVKDSTQDDGIVRWQPLARSSAQQDPDRGKPAATASDGERNAFTTAKGVVLQAFPDAKTTVPSGAQWNFLGASRSSIWQLPQVQNPNLLWAGWSTQAIPESDIATGVQWTLNKLQMLDGSAPQGNFSIYESDTFGNPSVLFHATGQKITSNTFTINKNAHVHANWSFAGEGTYCMAFTRATRLPSGRQVQDAFTLAVAVGRVSVKDVDPYQCFGGKTIAASSAPIGAGDVSNAGPLKTKAGAATDPCATTAGSAVAHGSGQAKTILSFGHMDWNAQIRDGRLRSYIGDDSTGQRIYRDPAQTILWLKPSSKVTLPAGYGSVGSPGTSVWQIPQTQNPSLVWLGWSTELINVGLASSPVTWQLTSVEGPGTVKVYTTGSFGGVEQMVFNGPGSHTIALGSHVHANWAFSRQGVYRLHFTESVKLANGLPSSDSEVLTIVVGDVDPTAVDAGSSGANGACGSVVSAAAKSADQSNAQAAGGQTTVLPGSEDAARRASSEQAMDVTLMRVLLTGIGGLMLAGALGAGFLWYRNSALMALLSSIGLA